MFLVALGMHERKRAVLCVTGNCRIINAMFKSTRYSSQSWFVSIYML